ncbi:hypothetical protein E4T25_08930 [Photobacterium damselae subsp. piscicida]|uniref:hypothetical protein n=1 Tax=Photobacterium damselae TaxID=38293 RepID=UPI0010768C33|nr:hypothetical protein [Photobacterium damselae]TFZ60116.1 hypothetical protein E4T25_08930 [Photobacterium damselae subsp. piscicida]
MKLLNTTEFCKKCKRPIYYKSRLNKLRNGETLILGSISEEIEHQDNTVNICAQAYIQKKTKGIYQFTGLWTVPTKTSRPMIWCSGDFRLEKSNLIFDDEHSGINLYNFFLICRWLKILKRRDENYYESIPPQNNFFYMNGLPYIYDGLELTKNYITKIHRIVRFKEVNNELVYYNRGENIRISLDNNIDNILTPPLKAIFEVGILTGCINFDDDTPPWD